MHIWGISLVLTVFETGTFHLAGYSTGKGEEPLNQRDLKISYRFGGHSNLCMLSGLYLICILNHMKSPFPEVFDEIIFLYSSLFSPKSVSSSHDLFFLKICFIKTVVKRPCMNIAGL